MVLIIAFLGSFHPFHSVALFQFFCVCDLLEIKGIYPSYTHTHTHTHTTSVETKLYLVSYITLLVEGKERRKCQSLSCVRLFETPWTVAHQASLSMGFPRQEYRSGLPFPSPHLPNPGIKPGSPALQVTSLPSELPGRPCGRKAGWNSAKMQVYRGHTPCSVMAQRGVLGGRLQRRGYMYAESCFRLLYSGIQIQCCKVIFQLKKK